MDAKYSSKEMTTATIICYSIWLTSARTFNCSMAISDVKETETSTIKLSLKSSMVNNMMTED